LTSEIEASEFTALGLRCTRSAVVANGVDLPANELLGSKPAEASANGTGRPYVLFLGRLNWKKGIDRLIPAMAQVRDADLLLAGNDEENYRPELEALARRFGVLDQVRFLGPVDDESKWSLLASAQILALPSYSENFGNVVLEAMAARCPVIVTPEVGIAGVVREAQCGIVAKGDPEKLGFEIKRLLADAELCAHMGRAGRHVVETKYAWRGIAQQMVDLYNDILISRGGSVGAGALACGSNV
jgi:glycosyltransferase involved in cell wall biosynthesis